MRPTASATAPLQRTTFADRHLAARDAVLASQRGRLIEGIVEAVGEKGYAATTLSDIVSRARVSRSTFYEHFTNKADCFIAAMRAAKEILTARILEELEQLEQGDKADLKTLVRTMIETYCTTLVTEPEFARVVLVDAFTVDHAAVLERDEAVDFHGAMYRDFYRQARDTGRTDLPPLSDEIFNMIPDAIAERSRRLIARGRLNELPALMPAFVDFVYRVLGIDSADTQEPLRN